jgi:plastocyanin
MAVNTIFLSSKKKDGMMKNLIILLSIALLFLAPACSDDDVNGPGNNQPPANQVWMMGNAFVPSSLTVQPGTEVTWVNKDGVTHTVTSSSMALAFESGNLGRDQTFSFTFDSTGTYTYHCRLHAGMTGTVIIQ